MAATYAAPPTFRVKDNGGGGGTSQGEPQLYTARCGGRAGTTLERGGGCSQAGFSWVTTLFVQGAAYGREKVFVDSKLGTSTYQLVTAHRPAEYFTYVSTSGSKKSPQSYFAATAA